MIKLYCQKAYFLKYGNSVVFACHNYNISKFETWQYACTHFENGSDQAVSKLKSILQL